LEFSEQQKGASWNSSRISAGTGEEVVYVESLPGRLRLGEKDGQPLTGIELKQA
jgi:hypothetical protein